MAGTTALTAPAFLNTKECEFSDVAVFFAGKNVAKFTALEYGNKQDKEHLFAAGDDAISIQKGNRTGTGSVEVLLGTLNDLNEAVQSAGGRDLLDCELDIVVSYKAFNSRRMRTVTIVGAQFTEFSVKWTQGDKNAKISLPMLFLRLLPG